MTRPIKITGFKLAAGGKLVPDDKHLDVSARLRRRGKQKPRVAKKGTAG